MSPFFSDSASFLVALLAAAGILGLLAPGLARRMRAPREAALPACVPAGWLLCAGERVLFDALDAALGERFAIFAKVRLAEVVRPDGRGKSRAALDRLSRATVDFILCDRRTLRIVGAVALVAEEEPAARREPVLAAALAAARIPLAEIEARRAYQPDALAARVLSAFEHGAPAPACPRPARREAPALPMLPEPAVC